MVKKILSAIPKLLGSLKERIEFWEVKLMTTRHTPQRRGVVLVVLVTMVLTVLTPSTTSALGLSEPTLALTTSEREGTFICKSHAWIQSSFGGNYYAYMKSVDNYDISRGDYYDVVLRECMNWGNWLNELALNQFKNLVLVVLGWLGVFFTYVLGFLTRLTSTIIEFQNAILHRPEIGTIWGTMLDIANVIFVIALLIFAVMIILRQTGYNFKKAVTSLVVAAVLANTSKLIVQALNAMTNRLAEWASNIFQFTGQQTDGGAVQSGAAQLTKSALTLTSELFSEFMSEHFEATVEIVSDYSAKQDTIKILNGLTEVALMTLFVGFGVYILYRLLFLFTERMVRIILYFVFAPLVFAAGLLPNKQMADIPMKWWSEVLKWLLVYPAAVLIMGFALQFMNMAITANSKVGTNGLLGGAFAFLSSTESIAEMTPAFEAFAFGIIAFVLLLTAANITKVTGITATAATGAAAAWGIGMFKKGTGLAWRTAAAPFKAGAKYAGQRALGVAKNVGYRLATTGPLKPVTEWAYKISRKPKLAEEAQAKERELYFKGIDNQQLRARYVGLNKQVTQAQDSVAKAQFGKKYKDKYPNLKYSNLEDDEKKKVDKTLGRNPIASTHIRNLKTMEGGYMRALGDAAKTEYELGKFPAETYKEFKKYIKRYKENSGDMEAAEKIQILFDVLKRQSIHLTGDQRKEAILYRNEIAGNENYMTALKDAGFPEKFGRAAAGLAMDTETKVRLLAKLAVEVNQVTINKTELDKLEQDINNIGVDPRQAGQINESIQKSKSQTLQAMVDPTKGSTLGKNLLADHVNFGIEETMTKLNQADKTKISQIQQSSATESNKVNSITAILANRNTPQPTRSEVATVLAGGVAVDDLGRARTIAEIIYQDPAKLSPQESAAKPIVQQQVGVTNQYREVQARVTQVQQYIAPSIENRPGVIEAIRTAQAHEAPGQTSVDQLIRTEIPKVKENLLVDLGNRVTPTDVKGTQEIFDKKLKGSSYERDVNPILDRFKIPTEDMTVGEALEMLASLEAAPRNQDKNISPEENEEL